MIRNCVLYINNVYVIMQRPLSCHVVLEIVPKRNNPVRSRFYQAGGESPEGRSLRVQCNLSCNSSYMYKIFL